MLLSGKQKPEKKLRILKGAWILRNFGEPRIPEKKKILRNFGKPGISNKKTMKRKILEFQTTIHNKW